MSRARWSTTTPGWWQLALSEKKDATIFIQFFVDDFSKEFFSPNFLLANFSKKSWNRLQCTCSQCQPLMFNEGQSVKLKHRAQLDINSSCRRWNFATPLLCLSKRSSCGKIKFVKFLWYVCVKNESPRWERSMRWEIINGRWLWRLPHAHFHSWKKNTTIVFMIFLDALASLELVMSVTREFFREILSPGHKVHKTTGQMGYRITGLQPYNLTTLQLYDLKTLKP